MYGGDTLEEAMRNATNGLWLKGGQKNCAFYVVVGNNLKDKNAEFSFYRTGAQLLQISNYLMSLIVISMGLSFIF